MKEIYLWAKKSENNGCWKWLSLYQHSVDTKNVAGLLWEYWLSRGQKNTICEAMGAADEAAGKNLLKFLAAVHDMGKATPSFQVKKGFTNSEDLDSYLVERLENQGFSGLGDLKLSKSAAKVSHALAGQFLLNKYGVKDNISSLIGGHHGKPSDDKLFEEEHLAYLKSYYQSYNENDDIAKKWAQIQKDFFDWALGEGGYKKAEDLPEISQAGQVLLLGLIIMADWIASNESYFPLLDLEIYSAENSNLRLKYGWEKWFKTAALQFDQCFDIDETYAKRFGFRPRNVQAVFSETIDSIDEPGLIILEAPMGLGKTEAALIGAEQLAYKKDRSGLFIGLPTQATANGMFSRVLPWLKHVSAAVDENVSIQLQHGKANLNDEFISLATNINVDDAGDGVMLNQWLAENTSVREVISNKWFSSRKTSMLDDFVVGTVDGFLLSALKQKHLALRYLGLSKKVLVIDEVHAYDAYMNVYLERALEWMGAYDVPVILLSATLPANSRASLVKAYLKGKGIKQKDIIGAEKVSSTTAYPLITYTDGRELKTVESFEQMKNKAIQIKRLDREKLYDKVKDLLYNGGIIGIIVNTVKEAQEIAEECAKSFGEENVFLLHSGFIATDRLKKEKELINMIGKGAKRPDKKIIIGTQVIEQSLDIDFDVMISELAPMDLLIQRIGRLHRHDIKRPPQHEKPVLYVIGTSDDFDFNKGSVYVYGSYLLAKTQTKLPNEINIPSDISPLVQSVYGDTKDEIEPIQQMNEDFINKKELKKGRAKTYLLPETTRERFDDDDEIISLIGWLKDVHPNQSEEYGYAQVRDSEESIEIIALRRYGKGYGFFDKQGDISDSLDDNEVLKKMASSTLKLPSYFSMYGNADKSIGELEKYNKEHLYDWQEKIWLKGSLGLIFDEDGRAEICNKTLQYSQKYGLSTLKKENSDEQI